MAKAKSPKQAIRKRNPPLSAGERLQRFKEMAREVEAEGEAPDFDETVKRLATQPKEPDGKKARLSG